MKLQDYLCLSVLFLIIMAYSYGCKKSDEPSLSLNVDTPLENAEFTVGESIRVSGNVRYSSPVKSIKIVLWDNFNNPALPAMYIHPNENEYEFDLMYLISDSLLNTGEYELLISASDGNNETRVFRKIKIMGVEREFEQLIVIAPPNNLKTYVYSVDTDRNIKTVLNLAYGYQGSAFSNDRQKLYIIKPQPSVLYTFDITDFSEVFDFAASPPYPEFNSVCYYDNLIYLPGGNGDIRGLDNYGNISFVTPLNTDTLPQLAYAHSNYIIAFCTRRGGPERFIKEYYKSTGVYRALLKIEFSVVDFYSAGADIALAFGNNDDLSGIYYYNSNENSLVDKIDLPQGSIKTTLQLSSTNYLIAHDMGVLSFSRETQTLTPFLPGLLVEAMAYDYVNKLIYLGREKIIYVYPLSGGDPLDEIKMPYPVQDIYVQYNK